jgi:hypothetical protein
MEEKAMFRSVGTGTESHSLGMSDSMLAYESGAVCVKLRFTVSMSAPVRFRCPAQSMLCHRGIRGVLADQDFCPLSFEARVLPLCAWVELLAVPSWRCITANVYVMDPNK